MEYIKFNDINQTVIDIGSIIGAQYGHYNASSSDECLNHIIVIITGGIKLKLSYDWDWDAHEKEADLRHYFELKEDDYKSLMKILKPEDVQVP